MKIITCKIQYVTSSNVVLYIKDEDRPNIFDVTWDSVRVGGRDEWGMGGKRVARRWQMWMAEDKL